MNCRATLQVAPLAPAPPRRVAAAPALRHTFTEAADGTEHTLETNPQAKHRPNARARALDAVGEVAESAPRAARATAPGPRGAAHRPAAGTHSAPPPAAASHPPPAGIRAAPAAFLQRRSDCAACDRPAVPVGRHPRHSTHGTRRPGA